jgi:regulator of cell morphogenesis and NO signaling
MEITERSNVGEVVRFNFRTATVFQANNIDYCCGGNKSIAEACIEAGADSGKLLSELRNMAESADPDSEYINGLSLTELSDYIVRRHHSYVRNKIPFLKGGLDRICEVHGTAHPELFRIRELFNESAGGLTMHMQKEEIVLFPYIQQMEAKIRTGSQPGKSHFGSVTNPVATMMAEHETEGQRFDTIASISNNYALPGDACNTYRATINGLKDFEADLHRHIHLENNILFPKAIELESSPGNQQN